MKKIGRAPVGVKTFWMICVTCRALHYLAEWMLCTRHFLTTQRKSIKYKVATLYVSYYKKLSCHIEAMRCFTKSLEVVSMTPLSRACLSPCYYSIGTRSLSRTISEMFGIKWWHDLELWVRSHSRSLEMAPFDRPNTNSYWYSIAIMALSCVISEIKPDFGENHDFSYLTCVWCLN